MNSSISLQSHFAMLVGSIYQNSLAPVKPFVAFADEEEELDLDAFGDDDLDEEDDDDDLDLGDDDEDDDSY